MLYSLTLLSLSTYHLRVASPIVCSPLLQLDELASCHATVHMRAGVFSRGVVGALSEALLRALSEAVHGCEALAAGLSKSGYAQLDLDISFLMDALSGVTGKEAQELAAELKETLLRIALDAAMREAAETSSVMRREAPSKAVLRAGILKARWERRFSALFSH